MSSAARVVYASGMQPKTPFLFSMPPLFAWPLAFMTSIALLLAAALMFAGATEPSETAAQDADEPQEVTREVSSTEQAVYLGLLIVPVGLIPMMARRKRMNTMRWSIAGVGVGFLQLVTQMIFVHPLMVLLALVYLRSQPRAAPAPAPDVRSSEALDSESVEAPPSPGPAPTPRRRPPRRRRRPRF